MTYEQRIKKLNLYFTLCKLGIMKSTFSLNELQLRHDAVNRRYVQIIEDNDVK